MTAVDGVCGGGKCSKELPPLFEGEVKGRSLVWSERVCNLGGGKKTEEPEEPDVRRL